MDESNALFYGNDSIRIYIELPCGDPHDHPQKAGLLNRSLYGTRDASQILQYVMNAFFRKQCFKQFELYVCMYFNESIDVLSCFTLTMCCAVGNV